MKNEVQLCTYVDRLGKGGMRELIQILTGSLQDVFGGVHLLPFYYPIDGADAGFDPVDHKSVDTRLGQWSDIATLSQTHDVMADVIANHMSSRSAEFQDFLEKGDASDFSELFLTFDKVFPNGATEQQLIDIYRPRAGLPFTKVKFSDSSERFLWTTFTEDQIDIDVNSQCGKSYLIAILDKLSSANIKMIRLDAAGYAVKKHGTRCFMIPETFAFIAEFTRLAEIRGIEVLVEIHAHYLTQIEIAKKSSWVYDFALPPLVLHALISGDSLPLQEWYKISPRNAVTVLDTHDGIGIIDVAAEKGVGPGLLTDAQVDQLVEAIHDNSGGSSLLATGAAASNVDLYQVNCTYYDALGGDDQRYLISRLIQFFSPGVPQVYYVGLLAGNNDVELLRSTGVGRDINRHYYGQEEIVEVMRRPVVKNLIKLIKFRNTHPSFQFGQFFCEATEAKRLHVGWLAENSKLDLKIDFSEMSFEVISEVDGNLKTIQSWSDFLL